MSFSAENLDACAAQMASWQPFAGAAAAVVEQNARTEPAAGAFIYPEAVGLHNIARCNSSVTTFTKGGSDDESLVSSCPSLNANSGEVACPNRTVDGLVFLPRRDDVIAVSTSSDLGTAVYPPARSSPWEEPSSISLAKCHSLSAVQENRWDIFSNTPVCTFSSSRHGMMHEGRKRVGRWSRRKKQMSHAFLRSLWRWKEGVHARKRRKRAIVRSCSGSGARSYTSCPPAAEGASAGNPGSVIGTDSSGELFFGVVGNQISWGADFIASTTSSESNFCGGDTELRDAGAEHSLPCWFSTHGDGGFPSESGYNSEPGYIADSELNRADDGFVDDDDEDEKQPTHSVVWKVAGRRKLYHNWIRVKFSKAMPADHVGHLGYVLKLELAMANEGRREVMRSGGGRTWRGRIVSFRRGPRSSDFARAPKMRAIGWQVANALALETLKTSRGCWRSCSRCACTTRFEIGELGTSLNDGTSLKAPVGRVLAVEVLRAFAGEGISQKSPTHFQLPPTDLHLYGYLLCLTTRLKLPLKSRPVTSRYARQPCQA